MEGNVISDEIQQDENLNYRQRRFVAEYMTDGIATSAAIRAGYSEKTAAEQACRLLKNVKIKAAIKEAEDLKAERSKITTDYVLASLKVLVDRCMQAEPVYDRNGEPTGEFKFDSNGAARSLELLGKNLKLFTDKTELTGADGQPIGLSVTIDYGDGNKSGDSED